MLRSWEIIWFLAFILAACKDPYYPELKPGQTNFLVVEGFINAGKGATTFQLSRTVQLNDSTKLKAELNADVTVVGEDNTVYPLQDEGNGFYTAEQLNLDISKKYRLKINTLSGSEYASDFVTIKQTPPIEVAWNRKDDGVHIDFSTRDPQNNTHYYKWNFEETWEIHSHYEANYRYENGAIVPRDPDETKKMLLCWGRNNPSVIRLISTTQLASDVIDKEPVVFIPAGHEKLNVRYSILIKQYALDKQAYEFYQLMKKNTESLGSLFDPQPSDITGNIHCINNSGEKVIGYVTGSTLEEKRIFISKDDVPNWNYNPDCISAYVPNTPEEITRAFSGGDLIPYAIDGFIPIKGYYATTLVCLDCRIKGSNDRPSFW